MPAVGAQDENFRFNREFDLKRGCFDSGAFCGSNFDCNITLIYPDGSLLVDNSPMTDQISYRNITINQPLNSQLGIIKAIQSCGNTTDFGAETYDIQITADGRPSQPFPLQFSISLLSIVLVGIGLISDKLRLFQMIGAMMMIAMGVMTLYPGYSFINYSTLTGQALGFGLLGLGFYFFISHSFSREEQTEGFDQKAEEVTE